MRASQALAALVLAGGLAGLLAISPVRTEETGEISGTEDIYEDLADVRLGDVTQGRLGEADVGEGPSPVQGDSLSFLAVGNWGHDASDAQLATAQGMGMAAAKVKPAFIVSAGNNFSPEGISKVSDPKVKTSWSDVYSSAPLQKTWYTALGTGDYRGNVSAQYELGTNAGGPSALWRFGSGLDQVDGEGNLSGERRFFVTEKQLPNQGCFEGKDDLLVVVFIDTTPFLDKYWDRRNQTSNNLGNETHPNFVNLNLSEHKHQDMQPSLKGSESTLEQQAWLTNTLKEYVDTGTARWVVVVGHHPIHSNGPHDEEERLMFKRLIQPILEKRKVHLYVSGHDQNLQHHTMNGVEYVISGAGSTFSATNGPDAPTSKFSRDSTQGFASISANRTHMKTQLVDKQGVVLHEFMVSHPVGPSEETRCTPALASRVADLQ